LLVLALLLAGCTNLAYYRQSVAGHLALMAAREPIAEVAGDPDTAPRVRERLLRAERIREFASRELALPDNDSYRSYVALDRPYVLWNVVAAPEFSLEPKTWCFPIAGCVAYRGYYDERAARSFAEKLAGEGLDTAVLGVRAYSTLGWFDDPVLSTMIEQPEHYLAGIIFHELAHQRLYVRDDTAFNEAFATAVEREGVRRWLRAHGAPGALAAYERALEREALFLSLLGVARERLAALYASARPAAEKRATKKRIFAELRDAHAQARPQLGPGYDAFFAGRLNNAHLALVATYHAYVPAFERLLAAEGGRLPAFYEAVAALARLPADERRARLEALMG